MNGTLTGTERGLADLVERQLNDLRGGHRRRHGGALDLRAQRVALSSSDGRAARSPRSTRGAESSL